MNKKYRRLSDGKTVLDGQNRPIEWAVETYGGELSDWTEVLPPPPPSELELASIRSVKKNKKDAVLAKLKITEEEFKHLLEA